MLVGCYTNGIRNLHQHFVANTGSYQVFSNVTGSIRSRTVYLAGIFSAEGTTAVRTFAAIRIYNDLAAGQSGIAMRTANHKLAGRIDVVFDIVVKQLCVFLVF
jgi:hypothetical protein